MAGGDTERGLELTWRTGFAASLGEQIYFEVSEPPDVEATVVLGHGGRGNHAVWYQQVAALAPRFRVVTWDTRGFGRSTLETGRFDVEVCVEDLVAVLDAVGAEVPVHLVGHSMGGWWLTGCALAHRHRVASMIYTNTSGGLFNPGLEASFAGAKGRHVAEVDAGPGHRSVLGRPDTFGTRLPGEDLARAFLYQQLTNVRPTPREVLREAVRHRFEVDEVRALAVPTLVIGSTDDHIFHPGPLREVAAAMGARYVEVGGPGVGHDPSFEVPDEWNAVVRGWLEEHAHPAR